MMCGKGINPAPDIPMIHGIIFPPIAPVAK
jgi:hypothetical protein